MRRPSHAARRTGNTPPWRAYTACATLPRLVDRSSSSTAATVAIFDFDGTIADSMRQMLAAYNSVAPSLDLETITEERANELRTLTPHEAMRAMNVSMWKLPRIMTAVRSAMRGRISEVQPFSGIPEALRELWSRGCKTAVVSSNSESNIRELLVRHDLDHFEVFSCGATMFGKATRLRKLITHPKLTGTRYFYIGDETRDVVAAQEAGLHSISVTWGYATPSTLAAQNPTHLANTPAELVRILAS
jgi:phosphoglycolate phosphatase